MDIYQVGGAVRDRLLGLEVRDIDWVVVGATPKMMLEQGFIEVGRDFPVFLHPKTKQEYALARTERKVGPGHRGFKTYFSADVSLQEDLQRRDLTINAMAEDQKGHVIDPWGGRQDIEDRVLRHVSLAFEEDPLRILRVARFKARFMPQGFTVADGTMSLMAKMVAKGQLQHLSGERVWAEVSKALISPCPVEFFRLLERLKANALLFPGLSMSYEQLSSCVCEQVDAPEVLFSILVFGSDFATLKRCLKAPKHYWHMAKWVNLGASWVVGDRLNDLNHMIAFLEQLKAFHPGFDLAPYFSAWHVLFGQSHDVRGIESKVIEVQKHVAQMPLDPSVFKGKTGPKIQEALHQMRVDYAKEAFHDQK